MKVKDLSSETILRIRKTRYDCMIEKHEGPESWDWEFKERDPDDPIYLHWPDYDREAERCEFFPIGGEWVLFPIGQKHHAHLTVLHHFFSPEKHKLVAYLKDTTFENDPFQSGFVAICDLFSAPEKFYLTTFYHNWYMIDYDPLADLWRKEKDE